MTDLEKVKLEYADAVIGLEIAQNKYNEVKRQLIEELKKPKVEPTPDLGKKTEKND
jgi:hypothetical protein